jgi:hypothetical protein
MEETMTEHQKFMKLKDLSSRFSVSKALPDEAMYLNAMAGFDARADFRKSIHEQTGGLDFSKAANIAGAASGTTDKAVIPLYVDPSIIDLTRRFTPFVELMPRVTNYGRTAEFNQLSARGVGGFLLEDAPLTEKDDTYVRNSVAIKYGYMTGRVTGPYLAASKAYLSQQYVDALNLEIMNKTKTMRFIEEDTLINGNASGTRTAYGGATTVSGNEYSGLLNTTGIQTFSAGSTTITIANLRKAIRLARTANESSTYGQGNPDMMGTDFKTQDDIKALLQDYQRIVPTAQIAWGFQSMIFEGLPLIPSKFFPTGTNSKVIMVADSSTWQMRVLQDLTYEELAKTNDSYKFYIKVYEALICTAPYFNTSITSLA